MRWSADFPNTLVVACSDGRLQRQTDEFLHQQLGVTGYDRFYAPGGGGALASSGRDILRAQALRRECTYLVAAHEIERVILLFHGPAKDGPAVAVCADYRRKLPMASPSLLTDRQRIDALELIEIRSQWAGTAEVIAYQCEVGASGEVTFKSIDAHY